MLLLSAVNCSSPVNVAFGHPRGLGQTDGGSVSATNNDASHIKHTDCLCCSE